MTADHYANAGRRWALGAELVYRPIAAELIVLSPHPLAGHTVLDAGAGTGAASKVLAAQRARPVAMDLSFDMLAWDAAARPPSAVADIRALPLAAQSVHDAVGWPIPAWDTRLKTTAVPILGSLRWKRGVVRAASSRGRCHCQATNPPAQTAPAPTITPAAISTRRSSSAAAAPE